MVLVDERVCHHAGTDPDKERCNFHYFLELEKFKKVMEIASDRSISRLKKRRIL